ncbi:MAG: translocation/assembly module TamB [Magnetococcus sp. WYHC-3]
MTPGGGRVSARGEVRLDPAADFPFDLGLKLDHVTLMDRPEMRLVSSGQGRLTGDWRKARLAGEFTLDQGEMYLSESDSAADVQVVEIVEPGAAPKDATASVGMAWTLDVGLAVPGRVFVRGRGLESEWHGALRLRGHAAAPEVSGRLAVKRGVLDFLDRRFTLRRGQVEFTGNIPPTPELDIEAAAPGEDMLALVRLTGSTARPVLKLTSEPELPADEVLARLLFKRDTVGLTPGQALKLAAALRELQGSSGPGWMERVQRSLGLDRLEVGGGESSPVGSVKVGKYLSDRLYLELEKSTTPGESRLNMEWEMGPELSVESGVTDQSSGQVGVRWRREY